MKKTSEISRPFSIDFVIFEEYIWYYLIELISSSCALTLLKDVDPFDFLALMQLLIEILS